MDGPTCKLARYAARERAGDSIVGGIVWFAWPLDYWTMHRFEPGSSLHCNGRARCQLTMVAALSKQSSLWYCIRGPLTIACSRDGNNAPCLGPFERNGTRQAAGMVVIGREILEEFADRHSDARGKLVAWRNESQRDAWRSHEDIRALFVRPKFIGDHVVFRIKGNRYRLDTIVNFETQTVIIIRVGTHEEYDSWF